MMTGFSLNVPNRKSRLLSGGACAALLLCSAPAMAATAEDDADRYSGEIIVTAQKRAEALEKVPISISAVSNEQLQASGIAQVRELPLAVPAMRVNYAGTFVLPSIRGVGSIVSMPGLVQNVATYVDGFYVPTASASNFELVSVESVNVLKGPQGTLFGANATGGAIQVNTRAPQQELSGLVRVGYGSYNNLKAAAYITGGLTDGIAADLSASYERGDGYITNTFDNNDKVAKFEKWTVRPQLLIEPSDGISVRLAYEHTESDDPGTQMVVAHDRFSLGNPLFYPGTVMVNDDVKRVSLDNPGYARRKFDSVTMKVDIDLGFADLTSYTGYRSDRIAQGLDYEASVVPLNFSHWTVKDKTFTQELNLTSKGGGRFNWVLGGFYMNFKDDYDYNTNGADVFMSENNADSYAVFAEGTYELVDDLYLTLGGRYTHDKPCVAFNLQAAGVTDSGCASFNDFSMRSVLRYEVTPNSSIYASYSQGYRSGGLPASTFNAHVPVKPEFIDAYEVGYKLGGGPLRLNVAGFFYDYRDIQVTAYGAGGGATVLNAGQAHIYGIDGDLSWRVSDDLTLTLAASLTSAKYIDFGRYDAAGNCVNCAQGRQMITDPADPRFGSIVDVAIPASNTRVERTPPFSGSAGISYGFDVAGGRLVTNASLFYTDGYYFDTAHQIRQDKYALLNLGATWTDPSDHIDVSVYAKNVTNSKYYRSSFRDPYAQRSVYGEPVTFGGSVTYRF